jgi:sarcosine oxidase subunit gamma
MTNVILESPLVNIPGQASRELGVDGRTCRLNELPLQDMLNLRGSASNGTFVQAVASATGLVLPVKANTLSLHPERQLLWLGPDEWLLKVPLGEGEAIEATLRAALHGQHFSVVQVGSGNTTFALQGAAAADLLARGCPLDLHARAFPDGSLAQSHIAKANVTLLCLQAGQSYELTVRRSFADYLFRWLCEAGT